MVYEVLLCPHINGAKYQGFTRVRDYGIQPAILRTNKQIHKEASEVLYKKNRSAIITLDTKTRNVLEKDRSVFGPIRGPSAGFWRRAFSPVATLKHGKAGALPMLTIDLSVRSERYPLFAEGAASKEANERLFFIGFMPAVYFLCRYLVYCGSVDQLQLAVRLERPVGQSILEEVLGPFREIRGIGRAIITGIQLSSSVELTTMMESRIPDPNEIFERLSVCDSRAQRQMREQKWNGALDTLENALASFDKCHYLRFKLRYWKVKKLHDACIMSTDMRSMYVECCIKVERTPSAYESLKRFV